MDRTEGAPNLEFFSDEVRREWRGPTPYQPMDYDHIEPATKVHRGTKDETVQSPKTARSVAKT